MKAVSYLFEASLIVEFTKDDLDFLRPLCERHYDIEARALSVPGKGAILNAASVTLRDNDSSEVRVTYRQLGLLFKVLESTVGEDEVQKAAPLYLRIGWWMRDLRAEEKRIERLVRPPVQYDVLATAKTDPPPALS